MSPHCTGNQIDERLGAVGKRKKEHTLEDVLGDIVLHPGDAGVLLFTRTSHHPQTGFPHVCLPRTQYGGGRGKEEGRFTGLHTECSRTSCQKLPVFLTGRGRTLLDTGREGPAPRERVAQFVENQDYNDKREVYEARDKD